MTTVASKTDKAMTRNISIALVAIIALLGIGGWAGGWFDAFAPKPMTAPASTSVQPSTTTGTTGSQPTTNTQQQ